jgi:hypothetical protein
MPRSLSLRSSTARRAARAIAAHVGRRGTFLAAFGVIYLVYGVAQWARETSPFAALGPAAELLTRPPWAALWLVCGFLACVCAGARRRRGVVRPRVDALGYNALLLPPTLWVLGYALSAVLYLATGAQVGTDRAWAALVIWLSVVVAVLVVSGWPEPPRDSTDSPR